MKRGASFMRFHRMSGPSREARSALLKGTASAVPKESGHRSAEGWSEGVAEATDLLPLLFARNPNDTYGLPN
jgi:hypothetical protein